MNIQLLKPDDYHTQRNNNSDPHNECGNTSVANLLYTKGYDWRYNEPAMGLDDYAYKALRDPVSRAYCSHVAAWSVDHPERVPEMLRFIASYLSGANHALRWDADEKFIASALINDTALLLLGDFYKGQENSHFLCVTGINDYGPILADPYGNPLTDYDSHKGYGVEVSWEWLRAKWSGCCVFRNL